MWKDQDCYGREKRDLAGAGLLGRFVTSALSFSPGKAEENIVKLGVLKQEWKMKKADDSLQFIFSD